LRLPRHVGGERVVHAAARIIVEATFSRSPRPRAQTVLLPAAGPGDRRDERLSGPAVGATEASHAEGGCPARA
jgi:hypothetical protein